MIQTASQHNEFKPSNVVNVNVPVTQAQHQSQTHPSPDPHSRFKNTRLDIECLLSGFEAVELSGHEISPRPSGYGPETKAAIVEFRGNVDEPAISQIYLTAQIALHPPSGNSTLIRQVRWLTGDQTRRDLRALFRIQTVRKLAVAIINPNTNALYTYEGEYRRHGHFYEFSQHFQELPPDRYEVEIHLFGTASGVTVDERYFLELSVPDLILKITS